ncbi:hypothetical protein C2E23DRAFT_854477 [Lenzites betulinus]|nr:hypothetical protein C2E23DRAFT_854477 [Lenzites betulinus]
MPGVFACASSFEYPVAASSPLPYSAESIQDLSPSFTRLSRPPRRSGEVYTEDDGHKLALERSPSLRKSIPSREYCNGIPASTALRRPRDPASRQHPRTRATRSQTDRTDRARAREKNIKYLRFPRHVSLRVRRRAAKSSRREDRACGLLLRCFPAP